MIAIAIAIATLIRSCWLACLFPVRRNSVLQGSLQSVCLPWITPIAPDQPTVVGCSRMGTVIIFFCALAIENSNTSAETRPARGVCLLALLSTSKTIRQPLTKPKRFQALSLCVSRCDQVCICPQSCIAGLDWQAITKSTVHMPDMNLGLRICVAGFSLQCSAGGCRQ